MNDGSWKFVLGLEKDAVDLKKLIAQNPQFGMREVEVQADRKVVRRILELQDLGAKAWKAKKAKKVPARKRGK